MSRKSSPPTPLAAPLLALLCAWPGAANAADGASQITFDGLGMSPSWSPDGDRIVHVADRTPPWMGDEQLWVISATGGEPTQITFGPSPGKSDPVWSPDGASIAYVVLDGSFHFDIYVVPASGGGGTRLSDSGLDFGPTWSPDGSQIALSSHRNGRTSIWVMPVSGGPATQLTSGPGTSEHDPAWSPDGSRIAFVALDGLDRSHVAVMPANGGPVTLLTTTNRPDIEGSPAWSPDGDSIVFARGQSGVRSDLWIVPATGGTPVQLTDDPALDQDPAWSPAGDMIAFHSDRSGDTELWIIPAVPPIAVEPDSWGRIKSRFRDPSNPGEVR